jgi:hypothetical protein
MALFITMKQDLFPDEPDKISKLLKSIREARFASGFGCVHCGSLEIPLFLSFLWVISRPFIDSRKKVSSRSTIP